MRFADTAATAAAPQSDQDIGRKRRRSGSAPAVAARLLLTGAIATALLTAPSPTWGRQWDAPESDTHKLQQQAFESESGPPISIQADKCFQGMSTNGAYPLVIKVKNRGKAVRAELEVKRYSPQLALSRRYVRTVELRGDSAVQRIFVYPWTSGEPGIGNGFKISLRGAFPTAETLIADDGGIIPYPQLVGYIGDATGALSFHLAREAYRHSLKGVRAQRSFIGSQYDALTPSHAKPEDAPDRAVGYNGLTALVLGEGAERLSPAQWEAIRDWTASGGSLIVLGNPRADVLLRQAAGTAPPMGALVPDAQFQSAQGLELSDIPVLQSSYRTYSITVARNTLPSRATVSVPGTAPLKDRALATRATLGLGTVLYVAFDPTQEPFRSWKGLGPLWKHLLQLATPSVPFNTLADFGANDGSAFTTWTDQGGTPALRQAQLPAGIKNPFAVTLPPLRPILLVFLGYFVLAIPVTFVVLKRTRRMNLAWGTGPVLAVACAGGFYLFTAQLYQAPLSYRTSGFLIATGQETGRARFVGITEMFFPKAGSYSISMPGAEYVEGGYSSSAYHGNNSGGALRALTTRIEEEGTIAPGLSVGNLAFRRLYHEQTISRGNGVTIRFNRGGDGRYSYFVRNDSGRELKDLIIAMPVDQRGNQRYARQKGAVSAVPLALSLQPGQAIEGIAAAETIWPNEGISSQKPMAGHLGALPRLQSIRRPILLARTSGEDLGPKLGAWVGGDRCVTFVQGIPDLTGTPEVIDTLETAEGMAVPGGVPPGFPAAPPPPGPPPPGMTPMEEEEVR